MRFLLCLLAILLPSLAAQAQAPATGSPATWRFLAISDLHFDPLRDPSLLDRLVQAQPIQWEELLAGGAPAGFGQDTDWSLMTQTLDAMQAAEPHPDFLLMPGDFLAHRLHARFDAGRGNPGRPPPESAFLDFEVKTLQVILQQVRKRFPGVPILPVLGNNDDSCGDYRADASDATMTAALPVMRAMVGGNPDPGFDTDWTRLGSYDLPHPTAAGVRVIGLDNIFFAHKFQNCTPGTDTAPDLALLAWLRERLIAARAAGSKVWLMMHIPPGVDVYQTLTGPTCPPATPMWQDTDLQTYTGLLNEFSDVIVAQFSGHTHMAEFRLAGDRGFVVGIPAVSPIYLQNPAFQSFTYRQDGSLVNRTTMALTNFGEPGKGSKPPPAPAWRKQDDFDATWSTKSLDAASLQSVTRRLTDHPRGRNPDLARYLLNYSTGRDGIWQAQHIDPARAARAVACSAAGIAPAGFTQCFCPG